MSYHFITFATADYMRDAINISQSAATHGRFSHQRIFTMDDLDDNFVNRNAHILAHDRGAGYWIWKPYVIFQYLYAMKDNDILCYCDTKYLFQSDIQSVANSLLSDKDICIFHNKPNEPIFLEHAFAKRDALVIMNSDVDHVKCSPQAWAVCIILRKSSLTMQFVGAWLTYVQDYRVVTDEKSTLGDETDHFRDNRHDQTVLSLLAKKWQIPFKPFPVGFMNNLRIPYVGFVGA